MIEILPVLDEGERECLYQAEQLSADYAYGLYDGGTLLGYCLYSGKGEEGLIQTVSAPDDLMADGLLRAALAALLAKGIGGAVFSERIDRGLLNRLGFVIPMQRRISISEVLSGSCQKKSIQHS